MTSRLMVGAAVSLFLAALTNAPAALATPQQERMKSCNAEAKTKNLAGEERKSFMKGCLSGKPAAAESEGGGGEMTAQQQKMKDCNAEAKAKNLTGAERKTFMSGCLKG